MGGIVRFFASLFLFAAGIFLLMPAPSSYGPFEYSFHPIGLLSVPLIASAMIFQVKKHNYGGYLFALIAAGVICAAMNLATYIPTM